MSSIGILAASMLAGPTLGDQAAVTPAPAPVEAGTSGPAADPSDRPSGRRGARTPRSLGAEGSWPGMAGIALALAVVGGIVALARRFAPGPPAGGVQVVARVSLSPKHSVFMLRVGRRMLLVGAGPQGPPALIAELEDVPEGPPAPHQEDGS